MSTVVRWLAVTLFAWMTATCLAVEVQHDPSRYIDVKLQLGSDTLLQFPEEVIWNAEQPSRFQAAPFGPSSRSLIIRPVAEQEQRVFFRGMETNTLYLARFSTANGYLPVITVTLPPSPPARGEEGVRSAARLTVPGLVASMMRYSVPGGFETAASKTVLLQQAPLRITAKEVWSSSRMVGVLVEISIEGPIDRVEIQPASVRLQIPEFGTLRAMAADSWELSPDSPATRGYLVFTR